MRGFSLPEVLIAMFILLVGASGIITLQSLYLATDEQHVIQQQAQRLAKQKLADLQRFTLQSAWSAGNSTYNTLQTNSGGALKAGAVSIARAGTSETMSFDRQWAVTDLYFINATSTHPKGRWLTKAALQSDGLIVPEQSDMKRVEIIIGWQDSNGQASEVRLNTSFARITAGMVYRNEDSVSDLSGAPSVNVDKAESTDVFAHDLGNSLRAYARSPKPDANGQAVSLTALRFTRQAGEARLTAMNEFTTVQCQCASAGRGEGFSPAITTWQNQSLTVKRGQKMTKTIGKSVGTTPSSMCDTCCRDHHDTLAMLESEQYYRADNGLPHQHFFQDDAGKWHRARQPGDRYNEICRFKRVNGVFELYPDWQLAAVVIIPQSFAINDVSAHEAEQAPGANPTVTAYKTYLNALLSSFVENRSMPGKPRGRNLRMKLNSQHTAQQLMMRGIYLERLTQAHRSAIKAAKYTHQSDWHAMIAFFDVDLTGLANWQSHSPDVVTVTNNSLLMPNGVYAKGSVHQSAGVISPLGRGTSTVSAQVISGNAGMAGVQEYFPNAVAIADALEIIVE